MSRRSPLRLALKYVWVAVAVLACATVACAAPVPSASPARSERSLPPCGQPPSPDPDPPPPGAVVPPGARITAVREQPPVVQLNGYVESTPQQVRTWVEQRAGLEIVSVHEEPGEAQLLVTDGTWKTFVKARAICDGASLLAQVITGQDSDAVIPTPKGSPAP